ncbi:6810_t:CDS:2 [Gigaspora margarita]|uniref:6810_t:CDS:1 n=1 Tax=Gigaspora margarita TaxID=4874 RepID=A0ABM8VWG4_GIGMA|nr:6810_t:CDS:2 [Gigaspora margarita]
MAHHIPKSKIKNKQCLAISLKKTELHLALKYIDKALHSLHLAMPPQSMTSIVDEINISLDKVNKLVKYNILILVTDQLNLATDTIKREFKRIRKELWRARNMEKNLEVIQNIAAHRFASSEISGLLLGEPEIGSKVDSRCFIYANMRDLLTARTPRSIISRRKDENVHIAADMECEEYRLINRILEDKKSLEPSTMNAALTLIILLLSQMKISATLVINTDIKDLKRVLTKAYCHRYKLQRLDNTNFENHLYCIRFFLTDHFLQIEYMEKLVTERMLEMNLQLDLNPLYWRIEKPEKGTEVENYKSQYSMETNNSASILWSKT